MKKGKRRNNLRLKVALLIILVIILGYITIFILSSNGLFLQEVKENRELAGQVLAPFSPSEPIKERVSNLPKPTEPIRFGIINPPGPIISESKKLQHLPEEARAMALAKIDL